MEKIWLLAILIFVISLFLFWRLTYRIFKKKESMLVYWQVGIYSSTGVTALVLFLLKWTGVLTF